jgi:predicted nucleotidyltransferase
MEGVEGVKETGQAFKKCHPGCFTFLVTQSILYYMNTERYETLNRALEQILAILIAEYQPEKVILFGSMATGQVGEWSDLDLAIIKRTSLPFMKRLKEVALLCMAPVSVDYLVYTPEEFDHMLEQNNHFILSEIIDKGKVLYERQPAPAMA